LIISKTPFRISFVGGGTDLREFYKNDYGQVISSAINKYVYVVAKRQIGIVEYKYRVNWSQVEFKNNINDIEHPIVREVLKEFKIDFPVEITTFADIPARTGLGSSSSFTVGLINAISALKGERMTQRELAEMGSKIEVDILKRNMGKQDHYPAAYGGMNTFTFLDDESVTIKPIFETNNMYEKLFNNLIMFYTNQKRDASKILKSQNDNTLANTNKLKMMRNLVPEIERSLLEKNKLKDFGKILGKNWELKKQLTNSISNKKINNYYDTGIKNGALGGKLLGAGGGGFLLFYVPKEKRNKVISSLKKLFHLPIQIDRTGSRITYYDNSLNN
jgi:D-glycero-alpha-D-manno-heptose-7-phosphate kinase